MLKLIMLTLSKKEACNSEEHIAGSNVDGLHLDSPQWFLKGFPGNKTKCANQMHYFLSFAYQKNSFKDYNALDLGNFCITNQAISVKENKNNKY